jgi:hypothetical protein
VTVTFVWKGNVRCKPPVSLLVSLSCYTTEGRQASGREKFIIHLESEWEAKRKLREF